MDLRIENMTCSGCASSVTRTIQSIDPNARVAANPATHTVKVETTASPAAIQQALEKAGYPAVIN